MARKQQAVLVPTRLVVLCTTCHAGPRTLLGHALSNQEHRFAILCTALDQPPVRMSRSCASSWTARTLFSSPHLIYHQPLCLPHPTVPHPHVLTCQELRFVMDFKKPFFLIMMCDVFAVSETRMRLPPSISYFPWAAYNPLDKKAALPADLTTRIMKRLQDVVKVRSGHTCVFVHVIISREGSAALSHSKPYIL